VSNEQQWLVERREGDVDRRASDDSVNNVVYIGRASFRMEVVPSDETSDDRQGEDGDGLEEVRAAEANGYQDRPVRRSGYSSIDLPVLASSSMSMELPRESWARPTMSRPMLAGMGALAFGLGLLASAGIYRVGRPAAFSEAAAHVDVAETAPTAPTASPAKPAAGTPAAVAVAAAAAPAAELVAEPAAAPAAVAAPRTLVASESRPNRRLDLHGRPARTTVSAPGGEKTEDKTEERTEGKTSEKTERPAVAGEAARATSSWVDPFAE
jgi:hypothetical protein